MTILCDVVRAVKYASLLFFISIRSCQAYNLMMENLLLGYLIAHKTFYTDILN